MSSRTPLIASSASRCAVRVTSAARGPEACWNGTSRSGASATPLRSPRPPAPGRDAEHVMQQRSQVRLVHRARVGHQIAEVPHRALAEAGEALGRAHLLPATVRRDPARRGEVVKREHRRQAVVVARVQHPPVVIERRPRELALLGLDARPLEREAIRAEPERRNECDVGRVAVVVVAGVARRLRVMACRARARAASCRCRRCRPRPGAPRSPCPRGSRRESSCRGL